MENLNRIRPLAQDFVEVARSASPQTHYHGSASIAVMQDGNLLTSYNHGGPDYWMEYGFKAEACISVDRGLTWQNTLHHTMNHARAFRAGRSVYIIGQLATEGVIENPDGTRRIKNGHKMGDLAIVRSDDCGRTWGKQIKLTEGERWHQAPSNVWYKDGYVYLVMEKAVYDAMNCWNVNELAPVLMRARETDDLTLRESWCFAQAPAFRDAVDFSRCDYFGVPYYDTPENDQLTLAPGRKVAPYGWLETQVVEITDPNHIWFDPRRKTLILIARAHLAITGYACYLKVTENDDGTMTTGFIYTPSGRKQLFVPLPGGQMKFHIVYDSQMRLYWLLSTQATDSMIRVDRMPHDRFGLPDSERQRLVLHYSKNCVDWIFAGVVAIADHPRASRHYAAMDIQGDDLVIVSRSGDEMAQSAHNGNIITFHRVKDFRGLVY